MNPLTVVRGGGRGVATQLPGLPVRNAPQVSRTVEPVIRDVTPPKTYFGAGNNRQVLKGDYDYNDAARLTDESKDRIAAVVNSEEKVAKVRKVLIATGAVSGSAVAGLGILDLLDIWEAFPPAARVEAAGNIAQEVPESAEIIREANNVLADAGRLTAVSYTQNLYGETNIAADETLTSKFGDILDPQRNEYAQLLDSTYAMLRARRSLSLIEAEAFIYNNTTPADRQVLEDRYNAKFK